MARGLSYYPKINFQLKLLKDYVKAELSFQIRVSAKEKYGFGNLYLPKSQA